jgi:hypothetical protein
MRSFRWKRTQKQNEDLKVLDNGAVVRSKPAATRRRRVVVRLERQCDANAEAQLRALLHILNSPATGYPSKN